MGQHPNMPCKDHPSRKCMAATPEPGQLVEVRRRQYVVADITRSRLHGHPLNPSDTPHHLAILNSIDEDGLGEELQVVWELEPGARLIEGSLMPDATAFDPPKRLDAFIQAVSWGAIQSADNMTLQAPFRAGIEIEDYQLDPLVRSLRMPRVNLLIADDVGLGKTIEAGLVAQELILRNRVRSVLIVVPASLQTKWQEEMRDRFGLEFRIVDTQSIKELRRRRGLHVNPWTHFPRLITSIDYLKRERPMARLRDVLPSQGEAAYPRRFDLLIVDEAHNVAPSGRGRYAVDSLRTQAIRSLAPHFEHKLFLTATPHNGYRESFTALLELLDDQRFARDVPPDPRQLQAVMVQRLKSELPPDENGRARFPKRRIVALEVDYDEQERDALAKLRHYADLRRGSASNDGQRVATDFVLTLLQSYVGNTQADRLLWTATPIESTSRQLDPPWTGVVLCR